VSDVSGLRFFETTFITVESFDFLKQILLRERLFLFSKQTVQYTFKVLPRKKTEM